MEEIVFYIPGLQRQFYKNEEFQYQFKHITSKNEPTSKVVFVSKVDSLYLRSVSFASLNFQFITIDFKNNRLTFRWKRNEDNTNRQLYEVFTSLRISFYIKSMSLIVERPIKQKS